MPTKTVRAKCIGFLGRINGHRFDMPNTLYVVRTDYCVRCGMPVGGWVVGA